jgi:hypothetical protein
MTGPTLTRVRARDVVLPDDPRVIPEDEAGSSIGPIKIVSEADDRRAAERESC